VPDVWLVRHAGYRIGLHGIPLDPLRADRIAAYLLDEGLVRPRGVSRPIPASLENLGRVHRAAYLESLDRGETLEAVFGFEVEGANRQVLVDHQRLIAGGTIQATRLALRTGRPAVNLGGGLHHATPEAGMAFCLFNDVAVAIRRLRAKRFDEPILVVDLDVHDGNGTRVAFADDPSVFTFSVHSDTWDNRPAVADRCIALGEGVTDDRLLDLLRKELPPVFRSHLPGLVIFIAGADPGADDTIGNWNITPAGMLERDRMVFDLVRETRSQPPLVITLGGGYGDRAWRYPARSLAWLLSGHEYEVTEDVSSVIRMYRRIDREAVESVRPEPSRDFDWELTEEDFRSVSLGTAREDRVLGALSKHAIELSLERVGILSQIRALGLAGLTLRVEATPPLGHTLALWSEAGGPVLLMEQRVSRNRSAIPDRDLLYAEWLLLQNPRAEFSPDRPPLPDQSHPGLGLLREFVAWWVVLCERLRLDGVLFVPAHYYMAALGRRHLRFLTARDEATYDAFRAAVTDLSLPEASRAIDAGHVIDAETGRPATWHTPLMVLPVSSGLRAHTRQPGYEAEVEKLRSSLDYRRVG